MWELLFIAAIALDRFHTRLGAEYTLEELVQLLYSIQYITAQKGQMVNTVFTP